MKPHDFLNKLEHDMIVRAIAEVESKIDGEIRVFISRKETKDPVASAEKVFHHLGMQKLPKKNGVLLFVAPRSRRFAVIGDAAVHRRCGDSFWTDVTGEMAGYFRKEEFSEGILHGVQRAGKILAEHFPKHGAPPPAPHDPIGQD
jgi:uncharacterized membrane protein